jgi:O-antigen/teichoic acid export membrane protein
MIAFSSGLANSFALAFGNGDVLPIGAVILMGAAADAERDAVKDRMLSILKGVGHILAVVCFLAFGVFNPKAAAIFTTPTRPVAELFPLACFSVIFLVFSVAFATFIQSKLHQCRVQSATGMT